MNVARAALSYRLPFATALAFLFVAAQSGAARAAVQQEQPPPPKTEEPKEQSEETTEPTDILPRFSDQVVVSASRVEQEIVNAPAAIAVISREVIETQAANNFGDLLRQAPGVNVTQLSSTHYSVTSRGSSSGIGHLAARPGGRAICLSGLLRLYQLGLSFGGAGRPGADRGGQRAGFSRLGRERHERRGESDHQGAAGRSGDDAESPVRHVRSQRHRQPDGRG